MSQQWFLNAHTICTTVFCEWLYHVTASEDPKTYPIIVLQITTMDDLNFGTLNMISSVSLDKIGLVIISLYLGRWVK